MTVWFISDTHFFHGNMMKFLREDGTPVRSFDSVEEMNDIIAFRWNTLISPNDKVYHLGDVTFKYGEPFADLMRQLNGKKRLILGNHDRIKGTNLINFFERVELWRPFGAEGFFASHVPINPENFPGKTFFQVHGHIHEKTLNDPRYMNVSVESIDYTPVSMDQILERVRSL